MKLKYYLRGLGIGIICTAIIMGIALSGKEKEKLTDAEIVERARLLGMVMAEEADSEKEEKESQKEEEQDKEKTDDKPDAGKNNNAEDKKDTGSKVEEPKEKNDPKPETPKEPQGQPEIKTIEIVAGDYSDVVSQKLFDAGLIADAAAFNAYLTESGADRGITVGVHKIPMGSTEEEIIKILGEKPE